MFKTVHNTDYYNLLLNIAQYETKNHYANGGNQNV